MKKKKVVEDRNLVIKFQERNLVAKYAHMFNRSSIVEDITKYRRNAKHRDKECDFLICF